MLSGDDAGERLAALKKLAAMGSRAASAVPAILQAMKDGDADFRRQALAALPKVGSPTAADVDALTALLRDASFPEGRRYDRDELAALGPDGKAAAPALADLLRDSDAAVKRKAAETLGAIGPAGRDAARRRLLDALDDPDADVAAAAAAALGKLGPPTKAEATDLLTLLHEKPAARRYALDAIRAMGPDAADFAFRLRQEAADDDSPELRRLALAALQAVAPDSERNLDVYTRALADPDRDVRKAAVEALVQVGPAHGAMPGLIQALQSDDEATAEAAEDARNGVRLKGDPVEDLGQALREAKPAAKLRILSLLQALGADAALAAGAVADVIRGPAGEARQKAIALATAMGPAGKKAAGALRKLLDDDKFVVRMDAATALAAVEGSDAPDAVPVLMEALRVDSLDDKEQAAQRDRAVEALGKIGEPAIRPLVDALETDFIGGGSGTKGKINADARLAAVKALGAIGAPADTAKVMTLLNRLARIDSSEAVRDAARDARMRIRKAGR